MLGSQKHHGQSTVRITRSSITLRAFLLLLLAGLPIAGAAQTINGQVIDATNGSPVADAVVRTQARPDLQTATTGADGTFTLDVSGFGSNVDIPVAAALAYDANAGVNYLTTVVQADAGSTVEIALTRIPTTENPTYQPVSSSACSGCHIEQTIQWRSSNHSRAAINPRLMDLYSGEGFDTPTAGDGYVFTTLHESENTGLCAVCHAPNENPADPGGVKLNEVTSAAGLEGVTCTSCHQLHTVEGDTKAIHLLGNAEFRFPQASRGGADATHEHVWGPLGDVSFNRMRAAWYPKFSSAELCASCHEYVNPDSRAPGQTTFSEWQTSPAAANGVQCQDCHMPVADEAGPLAVGVGQAPQRPAGQRHDHSFPGVYSGTFGDPVEVRLSFQTATPYVVVTSEVESLIAGHRWPTGVDERNALVWVEAFLNDQPLAFESGDTLPAWTSDDVPGRDPGDYDGLPGRGYVKLLSGKINGEGETLAPVPFIDAEEELAFTAIPPGATDIGQYTFRLPDTARVGDTLTFRATVIYRRTFRAIAVAKGWTELTMDEPWERRVTDVTATHALTAEDLEQIFLDDFEP